MNRFSRISTLVLAACAVLASTAATAGATVAPIQIAASGDSPVVAMSSDGAAHIAWLGTNDTSVLYCALPRGGSICAHSKTLTAPASASVGALNIFVNGTTIEIWGSATCNSSTYGVYRWAFAEDGAVTQSCKQPASGAGSLGTQPTQGQAYLDFAGNFLSSGGAASDQYFAALPGGTGVSASDKAEIFPYPAYSDYYFGSVAEAVTGGSGGSAVRDLGAVTERFGNADTDDLELVSMFKGNATTASLAALNTASNWSAPFTVPGTARADTNPAMVGDSSLYAIDNVDHFDHDGIVIAKLTRTPGPQVVAGGVHEYQGAVSDVSMLQPLAATSAHGIDLTWISGSRLRYANSGGTSADEGATMGAPGTIVTDTAGYYHADMAVAPDGQGIDVWQTSDNQIEAAPLLATADPADNPPPPSSTTTPPPSGGGTVTTIPAKTPTPVPTTPAPTTTTTTSTVAGGSVTLGLPSTCVAPGKTFVVTLSFKKSTRKGVNFIKVTKVDFAVNGSKKKTDKKAPFRQTLTVKSGTTPGSKVTVSARAYIKVHHGKQPKKSIHASLTVCH